MLHYTVIHELVASLHLGGIIFSQQHPFWL